MTLAQILKLALRQLDEDIEDISEYDDLFTVYANEGNQIAVEQYMKPRMERRLRSDEEGIVQLGGDIRRVVSLARILDDGRRINDVHFYLSRTGREICTMDKEAEYIAVCEVKAMPLTKQDDVPILPEWAHHALADYICFRHLSNGNMAKQSRAQHYRQMYYSVMQSIQPDGYRSVTREINLYSATDIRRR